MARGRMISKTLSTSVCFARLFEVCPDLAEFAQSLYPLLVSHADDFGREQGDLLTIKYRIHPRSPRSEGEFGIAMRALADVGLIEWYEARGRTCYQIAKFDEHQIGLHKRTRSAFPTVSGKFPEIPGTHANVASVPGRVASVPGQENRTEGNRTEGNRKNGSAAPPVAAPAGDVLLTFPTIGGTKEWAFTRPLAVELEDAYPGIDVVGEARKALAWIRANGSKTARGMPAFLVRWLNKTADSGPVLARRSAAVERRPAPDWRAECERLHGGRCGNPVFHAAKRAEETAEVEA